MSGSGDHRVHGLAGDTTAPDWPPITATQIEALLPRFRHLGTLRAITWRSPRPLSAAALIQTDRGPLFIKRHHASVRSAAALAEEHAFAAHLRAGGIPIPAIHADADGATAVAQGKWTWEVHDPAEGIDLYRQAPSWTPLHERSHARAAGAMLARLHTAAEGLAAPQRSTRILIAGSELIEARDPMAALSAQFDARPALAHWLAPRDWQTELRHALSPFHARVQARAAAQPRLWTHGDWHASNLCWSHAGPGAEVSAVLDFGLCARSFALFDLATAIERNAVAWLDPNPDRAHPGIALALLDGYRSVRPLDAADCALVADLLPVVHLDFALSEVEYFAGITRSPANAKVAWEQFLIGHMAWFAHRHGQALLDAIGHA